MTAYKPVPTLEDLLAIVARKGFRIANLHEPPSGGWRAELADGQETFVGDGRSPWDSIHFAMRKRAPKAAEMFE